MRGEAGSPVRRRAVRIAPNRTRVVAGALVLVVSTIAGALLLGDQSEQTQIYVASRALIAGQILEAQDIAPIAIDGTPRFPTVVDPTEVIGQLILHDLPQGTVLNLGHLAATRPNSDEGNLVGLRLGPGAYPSGVRRGDSVLVVMIGEQDPPPEPLQAVITHISEELNSGGDLVITLLLSVDDALAVARAGQDEMALVGVSQ